MMNGDLFFVANEEFFNPSAAQLHSFTYLFCGLYYKHITIVNDDYSVISKWHLPPPIDDAKVVIYNRNMFIIQATDLPVIWIFSIAHSVGWTKVLA